MLVDKYGRVAGNVHLAELAQMYAECEDDDLKTHYREVAAEHGVDLEAEEGPANEAEPETNLEADSEDQAPPRAGAGSGRDVWAAYAESRGVEVSDDMTRDEIIAAVEEVNNGNDDVS